jgi:hypothetical protein
LQHPVIAGRDSHLHHIALLGIGADAGRAATVSR